MIAKAWKEKEGIENLQAQWCSESSVLSLFYTYFWS